MKIDYDESSSSNVRYQHFQVLAMLMVAFVVYSLALQYTLICCREKSTLRFQNFSQYRNATASKQLSMFEDLWANNTTYETNGSDTNGSDNHSDPVFVGGWRAVERR